MDCKTFRACLGALLGGEVDDGEKSRLLAHARSCTDCGNLYDARATLRRIIARSNADERLPPYLSDLIDSSRKDPRP